MRLLSIVPINFGPFTGKSRLTVDPNVTVITGANDVGKSHVLRLVKRLCAQGTEKNAVENEINREYFQSAGKKWQDTRVGAEIEWQVVEGFEKYVGGASSGAIVNCEVNIAPDRSTAGTAYISLRDGGKTGTTINRLPRVIELSGIPLIGAGINLNSPNLSEQQFLRIAFGQNYTWQSLKSQTQDNLEASLHDAEDRLADKCRQFLPAAMHFRIGLRVNSNEEDRILVYVRDALRSGTTIASRGDGPRKLLAMLGYIFGADENDCHIFVADEPENSLHPGAQRSLRRILEEIAERKNVQVIYSTHSPVMINQNRLASVRVVTRSRQRDAFASAEFDNTPYEDNLRKVRACLGVHPSDSLLYSDVAVVVEGDTECLCLPELLSRFAANAPSDFPAFASVSESFHLVNGCGDSFPKLCKVAKGQGCAPIVFLDGDKQKAAYHNALKEMSVPFACLPANVELENTVPLSAYLRAVAEVAQERGFDDSRITEQAFEDWVESYPDENIKRKMLSKQVERWLEEIMDMDLPKAAVMLRAIRICDPCQLQHADAFRELYCLITSALHNK